MNDKISENPFFSNLRQQMQGFEAISAATKWLSKLGITGDAWNEAVRKFPELKQTFQELSVIPDKFNEFFSNRGWIAYESMNFETMKKAVELAEKGDADSAEKLLIDYHRPENVNWKVTRLMGVDEFRPRMELIEKAFEDYKEKRYHACIPVVLMMIDGVVNDIEQTGFFAESTDLRAWDSIAAHSSGLNTVVKLLTQSRKRTNSEKIAIPYRNGILHGRDLSYDSELVAAKTWALLFCVNDWAVSVRDGKKDPPPVEGNKSTIERLKDFSQVLEKFRNQQKESKIESRFIEEWKPRQITIGMDIPRTGASSDYVGNTPEREVILFLENWQKKNYGGIAAQIWDFRKIPETIKKRAGRIRESLGISEILGFSLIHIDDQAPAITEVTLEIVISNRIKSSMIKKTFRLIYENDERRPYVRGMIGGRWKIVENFYDLNATP
jgi:hypothetical protein